MSRWSIAAGALLLICVAGVRGQGPAGDGRGSDPTPLTVRVTAVVTDQQGRPILNLRASDFELREDGSPQKIATADLQGRAEPQVDAAPIRSQADEVAAARNASNRVFAIFLDEFHVPAGVATLAVREALTRFVDEQVRPGDLVAGLRPLDSLTSIHFTRDRAALKASIAAFDGRLGDYSPRTAFEEEYIGRAAVAVQAARAQLVTNALREITMSLGELAAARPAVIVVSRGFNAAMPADQRRAANPQAIARAASHFNIPFYSFDPDDTDVDTDSAPNLLAKLAADTGGEAFSGPEWLVSGTAQVSRDLDSAYLITYQPGRQPDGRFHALQVVAKRRGAQVRTRRGYWSPLGSEWRAWLDRATRPAPLLPMRGLRRSPLIDTWTGLVREPDGRMRMMFTWEPSALRPGGRRVAAPERVALSVKSPDGSTLFEGEIEPVRAGVDSTTDRALLDVPTGRMQLDLRILGGDGTLLDTGAQDVDVAVGKGPQPVILAPQVVRTWTARDFRQVSGDENSAPSPSREFGRTERLLIRTPAFDPGGAALEISAKLVNSRGQTMRQLTRLPGTGGTGVPQFDLPLAWLAPGSYAVEVTASNGSGIARELIRFRVTGG